MTRKKSTRAHSLKLVQSGDDCYAEFVDDTLNETKKKKKSPMQLMTRLKRGLTVSDVELFLTKRKHENLAFRHSSYSTSSSEDLEVAQFNSVSNIRLDFAKLNEQIQQKQLQQATSSSEEQPNDQIWLRSGDRICLSVEGKILAFQKKLNLNYAQWAIIITTSVVTLGVGALIGMGVVSKGFFRRKYVTLHDLPSNASVFEVHECSSDYTPDKTKGNIIHYGMSIVLVNVVKSKPNQIRAMNFNLKKHTVTIKGLNLVKPKTKRFDGFTAHFICPSDEKSTAPIQLGMPLYLYAGSGSSAGLPCGVYCREYYKDERFYLTTDVSRCKKACFMAFPSDGSVPPSLTMTQSNDTPNENQISVQITTYNVWMMPRKVSAFTSVSPHKNSRALRIAAVLPDLDSDIIVFTEAFDKRSRRVLLDCLKEHGYFYSSPTVGHNQKRKAKKLLNGGVVIVSRHPIVFATCRLFGQISSGEDQLADKGVVYAKIIKDGHPIHVFGTHLQAWNDEHALSIRLRQMKFIKDFMVQMNINSSEPVFFSGDFNVDFWRNEVNNEYDSMLQILDCSDFRNDSDNTCKYSFDPEKNILARDGPSTDGSFELLDFVLLSNQHKACDSGSSWVYPIQAKTPWIFRGKDELNLSDHFPVTSNFLFSW